MEGRIEKRRQLFVRALETSNQTLLVDLLSFTDDQEFSEITSTLESSKWIFPCVCKLGFITVLQSIFDFHLIDINTEYMGKTGLQYACQEGQLEVVQWLLDHGASLVQSIWREDSEFYLATLNGRLDVIDILLSQEPVLASDQTVCYCLMYAACRAGHLELVKRWFSPGIDVRETIAFTTDLNDCEHKYPLFAACEGEHFELAKFLILECGAAITEDICQYFPQFTIKLVRSIFLKSDTKHLQDFCMANCRIEYILPCWFSTVERNMETESEAGCDKGDADEEEEIQVETLIDLKENKLTMLPDKVLFSLRGLISLDASYNPLKTISDSFYPRLLAFNRVKSLNLSHCELESLSVHLFDLPCLEQLNLSYNKLTTLGMKKENTAVKSTDWKCRRLQTLDVSHNWLSSLPPGIQTCTELTTLDASYNKFTTVCPPWQCPMKVLDLSHNNLTAFAPSADQYWKQTLKRLYLQSNEITELSESIVKMRVLMYLEVSNNKIHQLPPPKLWCCPLFFLNLNDNQLGVSKPKTPFQKLTSLSSTPVQEIEFPKSCLAPTMMELFIANNDLKTVPAGIGDMENLSLLDLSENVRINELPFELGKLKKLLYLKLTGITVKDKELQSLISSLEDHTKDVFTSDVIKYLERKRRNCVHPEILKIVVLGCKSKNGPCIVKKLINSKDVSSPDHENLTVTRMIPKQRKSLTYEIWEIPDIKITSAVLPCFLTLNSLYIIIHDASNCGDDLHSVSEKILSIQACVLRPKIIVVCTFTKSMDKSVREKLEKTILSKSTCGFPRSTFMSVTLGGRENFDSLQQEIYSAWETMNDAVYEREFKLQQRQVPEIFLTVVNNVKKLQQNICRMDEFLKAIGCSRKDLEDGVDENLKLDEFLLQVGAMLRYNVYMGELADCVILNPTWLFKVLSKFLKSLTTLNNIKIARLPIIEVQATVQEELPKGDYDYFPAFLKLLETFNIGIRMIDSANKKEELLLVPSLLPKQPPQFQLDAHKGACKAARLYCLQAISPALWSHVISQLILAFERFSSSKWKLGEQKSNSITLDKTKSFRMGCTTSLKGLNIYNKNIQYWRTGIMMHYDQGHVVVEQVACNKGSSKPEPGILVTVQTTGSLSNEDEMEQFNENTKKLSVMGIVRDELEEVLELFNPKFGDPSEAQMRHIFALCPLCHDIKPGSGCVNLEGIHFKVRKCAMELLSGDSMDCLKGRTLLAHLVPEFLFLELPPQLHLSVENIEMSKVKLGHGMAGTVTKGTYKGTDVAIKVFHNSDFTPISSECQEDNIYQNVKITSSALNRQQKDKLETEQVKISNALSEVRREVGILSKLRHEFIVTFIGLCIRPQLLLVMELAPLGSLRKELQKRTGDFIHELEHPDTEISQMVFSKDLTYKIILQIGSGLFYLHTHNVIYRDMKPDNILVFSVSTDDRVNIKLSDYGISKFVTLQGVTGLFGTVGYVAPEVVAKQPYTEQADIYSYAIVMLEVLTGLPPIELLQRQDCSQMADNKKAPSHIQDRKIKSNFPYLQILMEDCWSVGMDERPTAENVVKRMKADQFLLLHDSVWLDKSLDGTLEVTCIYSCQTFGRWNIWISESGYGNHRYFSVYDITSCSFNIYRQECHGPPVTDMTKVGSRIWVVCKDLYNLQVIVRGTQNKFDVCHGISLEAKATQILNHLLGTSEESESFILVGLDNGCITAYHFNTSYKKSVTIITNIEFNRDTPVAKMCSINPNMIAVACGMSIYILNVELPDSRGAGEARNTGLLIPELVNYGSVSLKNVLNVYDPILSMVPEGNAIWCSMETSSCLVKVDVDNKKVDQVISLNWEPSRDAVILDKKNSESGSSIRQVFSDSQAASRNPEPEKNDIKVKFSFDRYSRDIDDDVFPETRRTSPGDVDGCDYDPSLRQSDLSSNKCEKIFHENTSDNDTPAVLSRRLWKPVSLPGLNTQIPPPVPKRLHCKEVAISVTSLGLSVDTLIVGTSCGGIVLLPLIYRHRSDKSGSLPISPFYLPMLRHPAKKKEAKVRTKSATLLYSKQVLNSTGSISALALANDKLVSVHTVQCQIMRNDSKIRDNIGKKREGSVFTAQSVDILNKQCLSNEMHPSNNTGHSDFHQSESVHANVNSTNQQQYADISVWDNITQARLKTVRSYGHELLNCVGLCCHSPDRAYKSAVDDEIL